MRIRVHGIPEIADLANDCAIIAKAVPVRGRAVVARNAEYGVIVAQGIARGAAGPHGAHYWKRISSDVSGLVGEYGPSAPSGGDYTGVSGASGAMRDLTKSAKKVAPRFQRDVGRMADGLFWP